jgi:sigma-B regulation protein RsbU (phosphoserine phosphatase)
LFVAVLISTLNARRGKAEHALEVTEAGLRVAGEIQQHLFPVQAPVLPGFDIAGKTYPAEATGGDYFDYIPMRQGRLGLAVGDVSGHGFGSALLMAETRAYLRALVLTHDHPGEALTLINRTLMDDLDERFITLFLGCLDPRRRLLVYAAAGHEGYLLDPCGAVQRLPATGIPLGVDRAAVIPCAPAIQLEPGHIVMLVTDGLLEVRSPANGCFALDRTVRVVRENADRPACEIIEALYEEVMRFSQRTHPEDDITLVVLKVPPAA